ncbi:uncharacterized protein LOC133189195 [Saccostrea echinata]|uniref:uncharacterized protein LOC133189195 n=1 Tax=Saccostrea echinata TaxID=191078 RepID=UPI002A7F51AD|nr:uncharacterized protein LOC133189195 [Saccostrea echinata]
MTTKEHEPVKKRTKKRTARDVEEEEDSNSDSENETLGSSNKKKCPPSNHSDYSTDSSQSSKEQGTYSTSHWSYKDLKSVNIFYEETQEPLEKFISEVKDVLQSERYFFPDPSKMTNILRKHLENLTFSYDLAKLRIVRKYGVPREELERISEEMMEYERQWTHGEEPEETLQKNHFYEALDSSMKNHALKLIIKLDFAVGDFAYQTIQLAKQILIGTDCPEDTECRNIFQIYCEFFGRIFFLTSGVVIQGSFTFQNRILRITPDIVYHYIPDKCRNSEDEQLLFIIQANRAADSPEDATDIKEIVGEDIMGQVGAELIGLSRRSVFYPNSLGIICMETKVRIPHPLQADVMA